MSDIQVKEQLEEDFIVYTKVSEDTELFIGISFEENVTEIVPIFEEHYFPDFLMEKVELFGEDITAIQTIYGASCTVTYLLSTYQDTYQL